MTTGSIFWFALLAASGGVLVFAGLLMERFSEKDWHKNISGFRHCKSRKVWGEWVVIGGIVVEIGLGIFSAIDEWQNKPSHRPISDITALAVIEVRGIGKEITPNIEPYMDALIFFMDSTNPVNSRFDMLLSDEFTKTFAFTTERGNNTQYSLRFNLKDMGMNPINKEASAIENLKSFSINVFFLPTNSEVTWGRVTLIANSEIQKSFTILPQIHPIPWSPGAGFMIIATNSISANALPNGEN